MRQDFSIGFSRELVALGNQAMLEVQIIFDDAVVRHIKPPAAVTMRMRIRFARPPVSRPSCVADAALDGAVSGIGFPDFFFKRADPADGPDNVGFALVDDRNTT